MIDVVSAKGTPILEWVILCYFPQERRAQRSVQAVFTLYGSTGLQRRPCRPKWLSDLNTVKIIIVL